MTPSTASGRRESTALESWRPKLVQQLAFIEQSPLYGLFLDLRKAYDAMDRGRCLQIMEDCEVGANARRLIKAFWDNGVLVCKAAGFFGLPFRAGRGVTQGGPVSPTIFNLMVDAIIREWERLLIIRRIPLGEIRTLIAMFYADDSIHHEVEDGGGDGAALGDATPSLE